MANMSENKSNEFGKPYVDAVDETGKNALMFAAIRDRAEVVESANNEPKVNLNAIENDGKTAVNYAKEKLNYKPLNADLRAAGALE